LAVLLVLLVPALLYVTLLQDLLMAKLENLEIVTSSPWDFAPFAHRRLAGEEVSHAVQVLNRRTYLDHTSAWNDYDDRRLERSEQIRDARLHQFHRAHPCWLAAGARPLTCRYDESVASGRETDGRFGLLTRLHGGQRAQCQAGLGFDDASLPGRFMEWWAHQQVRPGTAASPLVFPLEQYSVVMDPWALDWLKERAGGPERGHHEPRLLDPQWHPLSERSEYLSWVKIAYGTHSHLEPAKAFLSSLAIDGFLSPSAGEAPDGDDLDTPPVAFSAQPDQRFGGFHPSGFGDQRVRREDTYLGVPLSSW